MFFSLALPYLAKFLAPIGMIIAGIGMAIFVRAWGRRSRFGMIAGGLIGAAGSVVGHGAGVIAATALYGQLWPTADGAFYRAFAVQPGEEVTQIRSRVSISIQTDRQFLRFVAPPETIATLVRGRFDRSSPDDCRRRSIASKRDAPAWWTPVPAPRAECYVAEPYFQYPPDAAWLLYDPSTGQAYFHHLAVVTDVDEPDSPIRHFDVSEAR